MTDQQYLLFDRNTSLVDHGNVLGIIYVDFSKAFDNFFHYIVKICSAEIKVYDMWLIYGSFFNTSQTFEFPPFFA